MLQVDDVLKLIEAPNALSRFLNKDELKELVAFWFGDLQVPSLYFELVDAPSCLSHISTLASSLSNSITNGCGLDIQIEMEHEDFYLYVIPSSVSKASGGRTRFEVTSAKSKSISAQAMESYIEKRFFAQGVSSDQETQTREETFQPVEAQHLDVSLTPAKKRTLTNQPTSLTFLSPGPSGDDKPIKGNFRVQVSRTGNAVSTEIPTHLRFYFLQKCKYTNESPKSDECNVDALCDVRFRNTYSESAISAFQAVVSKTVELNTPVADVFEGIEIDGLQTTLLLVSHYSEDTHGVFKGMPNVYRRYCMFAHAKFVEVFCNNIAVFAFFLEPVDYIHRIGGEEHTTEEDIQARVAHIKQDATLHNVLPSTSFTTFLRSGVLSMQQTTYAYCAAKFSFHFLNRGKTDQAAIVSSLRSDATALAALSRMQAALSDFAFTEPTILNTVSNHLDIIIMLYEDFAARHIPENYKKKCEGCPTFAQDSEAALLKAIDAKCHSDESRAIFKMFVLFNKSVLKTNFYKPEKRAISFRLHPSFLSATDYPERPFGVFMIIGAEFRGFHVRFRDIARGGVRMIRSRDSFAYHSNLTKMFDECFNLASTQQRKNKDIPEGGSKGVILLGVNHQSRANVAFKKYVDALLDALLPQESWCVDHNGQEELIFLGPDEGTADYMDWASQHACDRGYRYWKAFTTGKSPSRGGIPHDRYGMTTTSVRAFVDGIKGKMGVTECTKFQTGGPDGDLGSNEILMGSESTLAVIDGSGVAFDPEGLNKEELERLARGRKMVENFNKEKFSDKGFFVSVSDTNVKLPDGTIVASGVEFRNSFHFNPMLHVDLFVPCGGRPNSVTEHNYKQLLFDENGASRLKYMVEGANLFCTQEARRHIEAAGVKLVKDASANKGGVTSSSLEVLACLALSDEEHAKTMQVQDIENPPETYSSYVKEVLEIIKHNAENEFNCLWNSSEESGKPMCDVSDQLSNKIVHMRDAILSSDSLFSDDAIREKVLRRAIPKQLCAIVPFETMVERLPESYLKALFASYLSSHFVYEMGLTASDIAFYEYAKKL